MIQSTKVEEVMQTRFATGVKRSDAYKLGYRTWLVVKLLKETFVCVPYEEGSTEFDAWFAGLDAAKIDLRGVAA